MTPRELAGALRRQLNPRRARWQKPAALVRALGLRRGEAVAEIGCGPGYFTTRLARAVGPAGHVFAVDPEAAVLDIMRRRLRGVRNVTPVLGREDDPLLPRGRCRTAVLINVYHHMRGGTAFLHRLVASLPRDARVINVDWNETSEFVAPRHPGIDLGDRLQGGCVHVLCVPLLIETDVVRTHVVVSERPSRRSTTR